MESRSRLDKALYRLVLYLAKMVPIIVAGIYLLNTTLSYFGADLTLFSYLVQFLFIGVMYASSMAFRFCAWHRMFIHYILIVFVLNIIDYHIGIPVSDRAMFVGYIILTTVCMFIIIYLKFKCKR